MNIMKSTQIAGVCKKLGMEAVPVPAKDLGQTMGALAGISGFERTKEIYGGPELPEEMLVMSGLLEEDVDRFLAACRRSGIPSVARKAILTPYNIRWTPVELFEELDKEHQAMQP